MKRPLLRAQVNTGHYIIHISWTGLTGIRVAAVLQFRPTNAQLSEADLGFAVFVWLQNEYPDVKFPRFKIDSIRDAGFDVAENKMLSGPTTVFESRRK